MIDIETARIIVVALMVALTLAIAAIVTLLDRLRMARLAAARRSCPATVMIDGRMLCDAEAIGDQPHVPPAMVASRAPKWRACYFPDCRCRFPGAICSGLRHD